MTDRPSFFGVRVVWAAFLMAVFGWGIGFYGPPVFLQAVIQRTGWSLPLVSAAVTAHFLFGALIVTQLPALHRRFGVGRCAVAGAVCATAGVLGWALAASPWQLFAAALASGAGWVAMGAVALNAAIAPWYWQGRPAALAKAYNGASVGGVVCSPLWVLLIAQLGFAPAVLLFGAAMIATMLVLSRTVFSKSPASLGQRPDGDARATAPHAVAPMDVRALPGRLLWRDRRFATLALGMAASLFAQIGLIAHLFLLLVPSLGPPAAGWAMGLATASAMAGRWVVGRALPAGADRRVVAALGYAVQILGSLALLLAGDERIALIWFGVVLFGSGIGNATSLPPLIAQVEFAPDDVPRVVALIVALAQATYAFGPAVFGLVLALSLGDASATPRLGFQLWPFFAAVTAVQLIAITSVLAGRTRAARANAKSSSA